MGSLFYRICRYTDIAVLQKESNPQFKNCLIPAFETNLYYFIYCYLNLLYIMQKRKTKDMGKVPCLKMRSSELIKLSRFPYCRNSQNLRCHNIQYESPRARRAHGIPLIYLTIDFLQQGLSGLSPAITVFFRTKQKNGEAIKGFRQRKDRKQLQKNLL